MFTEEQSHEIIKRRHQIVLDYCKQKKWDTSVQLSLSQIMEIRKQQSWKEIPKLVSEGK